MKKRIAFFLTLALVLGLLAGCAGTPVVYYTNCTCPTGSHDAAAPVVDETEAPAVSEGAVKTGLAILADVSGSKSADAENNGEAKYDVTLVAVTVDDNGVITACIIDSVGASVAFGATGEPVDAAASVEVLTKTELGDAYGMKAYAGSRYEWNEQAANFAAYVTGKTASDVALIHVDQATKPTDADLATSVTIAIGGFQNLIAKAVQ